MRYHHLKDNVVTSDDVRKAELYMNSYSRSWTKIFSIGSESGTGQKHRCNRALINNYSTIPSLQGLRKDHKGDLDNDPMKGPKLRPLCAANKAPNAALGNLVAKILKAVGDKLCETIGAEVISTDKLKGELEKVNNKINEKWDNDKDNAEKIRKRRRPGQPTSRQERDNVIIFSIFVRQIFLSSSVIVEEF